MIRWIGIFLIFSALTTFGFYKAAALKFRYKRLTDICLFIEGLTDKIRIGEGMKSIINQIGPKAGIFEEGYNFVVLPHNLKETDIRLAEDFVKRLGMGDTETEIKRCETFKELFKKELHNAETELKEKGRLYGKLGIFFGLLVGIVLI